MRTGRPQRGSDLSHQWKGRGPVSVSLNGVNLHFIREHNPYRAGAARIPLEAVVKRLTGDADELTIVVG